MPSYFCVSVMFLDPEPAFHGRRDGGEPEWPPSPLRLFQALVAATAAKERGTPLADHAGPALRWLEGRTPPAIVAPPCHVGVPVRIAVPNNDLNLVAAAWAKGREPDKQPAKLKTMKTIRPTRLVGGSSVHYLWELPELASDKILGHVEILSAVSRSIVALGWGIDLVTAHGRVISGAEAQLLAGERWESVENSISEVLRVPVRGTLDALQRQHREFLGRVENREYTQVPALSSKAFSLISYVRATDPANRPYAAFALLKPDFDDPRLFDAPRQAMTVAAMVRHAAATAAIRTGWKRERINAFIHGHTMNGRGPARGADAGRRFSYLPLPSLETRGEGVRVGSIRRVLLVGPPDGAAETTWARRTLSGQPLVEEGRSDPSALLSELRANDWNVKQYVCESAVWSTVTPVLLPGFDDGNSGKAERLLRKAFAQAGLPPELARDAEVAYRKVGFRAGVEHAKRYELPRDLRHWPRYHVFVRWRDASGNEVKVPGPLAIGAGRHRGFGVFATHST